MEWMLRKWRWASQNRLFLWNALLVVVSFCVIVVWPAPGGSDFRVRTLGMLLQFVGVFTVWYNLTTVAREFGKPGIFRRTWWWVKAGLFGPATIVGTATETESMNGLRARAKVRIAVDATEPLRDRIGNLEQLAMQIDTDLDAAYREIDTRATELDAKVKAEATERERAVGDVKRSLESATAGNYPMLLFGAVWLAVGVVLATWAPEIAKFAAGLWADALEGDLTVGIRVKTLTAYALRIGHQIT